MKGWIFHEVDIFFVLLERLESSDVTLKLEGPSFSESVLRHTLKWTVCHAVIKLTNTDASRLKLDIY